MEAIPSVSSDYSSAITENSKGLEESSGARSSVKYKKTVPRIWEETGGTSSSDKLYDSSVNPGGNATTSGGLGPRVRGSVGGESRVRGSVEGEVKTCRQTENATA